MKRIILLMAASLLISCNGDDSSSGGKLLTGITMVSDEQGYNNTYQFEYDNKNRMTHLSRAGSGNYEIVFHYENGNKPVSIDITGDVEYQVIFTYDSQERVTGYTYEQQAGTITYSDDGFSINGSAGTLTSSGDFETLLMLDFAYNNSKKGPMANVKGFDAILYALLEGNSVVFYTKKAVTAIANSDDPALSLSAETTFGPGGLPAEAVFTGGHDFTITYEYSN